MKTENTPEKENSDLPFVAMFDAGNNLDAIATIVAEVPCEELGENEPCMFCMARLRLIKQRETVLDDHWANS